MKGYDVTLCARMRACFRLFWQGVRAFTAPQQQQQKKTIPCRIIYFATSFRGTFHAHYADDRADAARLGALGGCSTKRTHELSERLAEQLYTNRSEPLNAENNNSINYSLLHEKQRMAKRAAFRPTRGALTAPLLLSLHAGGRCSLLGSHVKLICLCLWRDKTHTWREKGSARNRGLPRPPSASSSVFVQLIFFIYRYIP